MVLAGLLLALAARWWWVVGGVAAVASQAVITTSWTDARAGTVINVLLLGAAVYGWASQGPRSLGREYQRRVSTALSAAPAPLADSGPVVTEQDLATLTHVGGRLPATHRRGRAAPGHQPPRPPARTHPRQRDLDLDAVHR